MTVATGLLSLVGLLLGILPGFGDHGRLDSTGGSAGWQRDWRFSHAPAPQPAPDCLPDGSSDSFLDEEEDEDSASWLVDLIAPPVSLERISLVASATYQSPASPGLRAFLSRSSPLRC